MQDNLNTLIEAARQVVRGERELAGPAMLNNARPLPELEPPPQTVAAPVTVATAPHPAVRIAQSADGLLAAADGQADAQASQTPQERAAALDAIDRNEVRGCTKCGLCQSRTRTVFGEGAPDAALMFVGEGPGADEDATGRPFVGRAGQKLNEMIAAMGLRREQVYIANVVKCRPPGNRTPLPEEAQACWSYLQRQIQIIRPKVIVVLGNPAAKALLGNIEGITRVRGQWHRFGDIDVMPTFHPAYLLRQYSVENRRKVWSDLQEVMKRLGLPGKGTAT